MVSWLWLRVYDFIKLSLLLMLVLIASFSMLILVVLSYDPFQGLDNEELNKKFEPCSLHDKEQIIDAAISHYVLTAKMVQRNVEREQCSGLGGPPCFNPYPYFSLDQFKAKNPDCCEILKVPPGESPLTYRPNISGDKLPKMYSIDVKFIERARVAGHGKEFKEIIKRQNIIIDCYGNEMRQDVD